jgi:phosphoglycolate phosphatase
MRQPTVVFDLDGTLVDTAPDLIDTLNLVFRREGLAEVPFEQGRTLIGGGAKPMIERGLALQGRRCTPADISRLYEHYLGHYAEHIADRSRPFPGLVGALQALERRNCRLAVCTNKLEWLSLRLLDALGLTARFAAICGPDTFGVQKPDPDVLRRTVSAARGDPRVAVMVGDSETDIATARRAGIPVVAVDFGYTATPVAQLGPDRVISHFDALPAALDELFLQLPVHNATGTKR